MFNLWFSCAALLNTWQRIDLRFKFGRFYSASVHFYGLNFGQLATVHNNKLTGGFSCFFRQNPSSHDLSRCSSREGLDSGLRPAGGRSLESPSLLRRVIAGAGGSGGLADLDTPPASPTPFSYNSRSVASHLSAITAGQ
jgi:hypothetical protein